MQLKKVVVFVLWNYLIIVNSVLEFDMWTFFAMQCINNHSRFCFEWLIITINAINDVRNITCALNNTKRAEMNESVRQLFRTLYRYNEVCDFYFPFTNQTLHGYKYVLPLVNYTILTTTYITWT